MTTEKCPDCNGSGVCNCEDCQGICRICGGTGDDPFPAEEQEASATVDREIAK